MTNTESDSFVIRWRKFLGDPLILIRFANQAFYGGLWRTAWVIAAPLFRHWAGNDDGNATLRLGGTPKAGLVVERPAAHQEHSLPENENSRKGPVDLYLKAEEWLRDVLGFDVVVGTHNYFTSCPPDERRVVFTIVHEAPPGWRGVLDVISRVRWGARMKSLDSKVVSILPDTFIPSAALLASANASQTNGATVFLQNTSEEAKKYGYISVIAPVFWTFPPSRLGLSRSNLDFNDRAPLAVLAKDPWNSDRQVLMENVREKLQELEPELHAIVDGDMAHRDYIDLMRSCRISATTNVLQAMFILGSKKYKALLSEKTTTGRVWESLSSGALLITDETDVLRKLGFEPGTHYLDLGEFLTGGFPRVDSLADIAHRGNKLFLLSVDKNNGMDFMGLR